MKIRNPEAPTVDPALAQAVTTGVYHHPNLQPSTLRTFEEPAYLHLPHIPGLPILEDGAARLPFTSVKVLRSVSRPAHSIIFEYPEMRIDGADSRLVMRVYDAVAPGRSAHGVGHGGSLCITQCVLPEGIVVKDTDPMQITFPCEGANEETILGFREHGSHTVALGQAALIAASGFNPKTSTAKRLDS